MVYMRSEDHSFEYSKNSTKCYFFALFGKLRKRPKFFRHFGDCFEDISFG